MHVRADEMRGSSAKLSSRIVVCQGASAECRKDIGELLAREENLLREMEFFHVRTPDVKA